MGELPDVPPFRLRHEENATDEPIFSDLRFPLAGWRHMAAQGAP